MSNIPVSQAEFMRNSLLMNLNSAKPTTINLGSGKPFKRAQSATQRKRKSTAMKHGRPSSGGESTMAKVLNNSTNRSRLHVTALNKINVSSEKEFQTVAHVGLRQQDDELNAVINEEDIAARFKTFRM